MSVAAWFGLLLLGVLLVLLVAVISPVHVLWDWKLRHIPGLRPHLVMGNMLDFMRVGSALLFIKLKAIHGPIFRVWIGRQPIVVLTDKDHIRTAGYRAVNRTTLIQISGGLHKKMMEQGLLFVRGDEWRTLRKAWQPAFSSPSLSGYLQLMDQSAVRLAELLHQRCGGGDGIGERLDLHWELGRMTLGVVGTCAYGVDFQTLDDNFKSSEEDIADLSSAAPGLALAKACKVVFETNSLQRGSVWSRALFMLPMLGPILTPLAYAFPDRPLRRQIQARDLIIKIARQLIANSTNAPPAPAPVPAPVVVTATATAEAAAEPVPGSGVDLSKAVSGSKPSPGMLGVLPGSFMGLMLAARSKETKERLTETQLLAQAQVFLLAGFETTANALAFTIYLLSKHPEVERKLLEEIDSMLASVGGPGAALTQELLDKCEYTSAVFNEALRIYPPAHVTTRETSEPLRMGGLCIPGGSRMFLSIFATHHDPKSWPEPSSFRPERFTEGGGAGVQPNSHIPFGLGSRMCIGHRFAMLEAKVALIRLYSRVTFELEPGQDPLPLAFGLTLSPKGGIWVRPKARNTA